MRLPGPRLAMSFRRRMVLLAAGAVAAAVVLASVAVYVVTRDELLGQIDANLHATVTPGLPQAVQIKPLFSVAELQKLKAEGKLPDVNIAQLQHGVQIRGSARASGGESTGSSETAAPAAVGNSFSVHTRAAARGGAPREVVIERKTVVVPRSGGSKLRPGGEALPAGALSLPTPKLGGPVGYVQLSQSNGNTLSAGRGPKLPITAAARAVALGYRGAFFSDLMVAGTPARLLTERAPQGGVWFVVQPLTDLNNTLGHLRLVLAIVCLGGIALAVALGLLVSRAALVPVRRLTGAAERVARTQDLGHRIETRNEDELGRLSASFNTMLAALERSRLAQRQLVSDASHELRTPLTSVQANLDALALGERLPAPERARIVAAAQAQLRELTVLVGDLVDLSKTDVEEVEVEDVRLDLAVAGALQRARLHAPRCRFTLDAEPCLVRAAPARLDRAIANLLDNACKWNPQAPEARAIEVRVRDGCVEVRDHGPGIAPRDLPRVFDRFYRAPAARGRPGSGLGLAIVRQMAESHGGSVHAANAPDGGARLILELPSLTMTASELAASRADEPLVAELAASRADAP
jgi:two-component system sensor histidine kinase MprB